MTTSITKANQEASYMNDIIVNHVPDWVEMWLAASDKGPKTGFLAGNVSSAHTPAQ